MRTFNIPTRLSILFAIACVLTACGAGSNSSDANSTQSTSDDYVAIEAHADAIYTQIWGDAAQKEAAHYLAFQDANTPMVDCMDSNGFEFTPTFTALWRGWQPDATESSGWMGELDWRPSQLALNQTEALHADDESDTGDHPVDYQEALAKCSDSTPMSIDLSNPSGADELSSAFHAMLDEVNRQIGPIDGYQACMKSRGVDLGDDESGASSLIYFLTQRVPMPPEQGEDPSSQWSTYVQMESDALAADRTCRGEQYHLGLTLLEPMLDEFEAVHANELSRSAARQEDLLRQASQAGFRP